MHLISSVLFLIIAALLAIVVNFEYQFFFEAPFSRYKEWFPTFYLPVFAISNIIFSFLFSYCLFCYLGYRFDLKLHLKITLFIINYIILYTLFLFFGFEVFVVYFIFLIVLGVVIHSLEFINDNILPVLANFFKIKYLFFSSYLVCCLLIGDFHPFYFYRMFAVFPKTSSVFFIKNNEDQVLATEKYSIASENGIFELYNGIIERNILFSNNYIGEKIFGLIKMDLKNHKLNTDSLKFVRVIYKIDLNEFVVKEEEIFKLHVK